MARPRCTGPCTATTSRAADLLTRRGRQASMPPTAKASRRSSMAAIYGNAPMIDKLLKARADVKQHLANGETTVMLAARNGNPQAIEAARRGRRGREREGDVCGARRRLMWAAGTAPSRGGEDAARARRRPPRQIGPAGLPRNYMAPRVNTAAVKDAQRRYAEAIAAGRTYEQQLEHEVAQGAKISIGFRGVFNEHRRADLPGPPAAERRGTPPPNGGRGASASRAVADAAAPVEALTTPT